MSRATGWPIVNSDLVASAYIIHRVLLTEANIDLAHRFGLAAQAYGLHTPYCSGGYKWRWPDVGSYSRCGC
jgi:hypothetical protein